MGIHSFTNGGEPDNTAGAPGGGSGTALPTPNRPPGGAAPSSAPDILIDYNKRFKNADPALFRDQIIRQTIATLIRHRKPNPLLVGSAGVGKTKIVEEVARMIANGHPMIPSRLAKSTVYELPLGALVSGASLVGELESRVIELVEFVTDPVNDAILFIDEAHLLADGHDRIYSKIAQLLKPAMARGDLRLIAATTGQEARDLDDDPAFSRRLSRLIVDELTTEQTEKLLDAALPGLLTHYQNQILVPAALLPEVVRVSEDFKRADQHRPDSALTLLDQSMADLAVARGVAAAAGLLTPAILGPDKLETVARRLASGTAEPPDATRPLTIRARLHADLVGQDAVCDRIADVSARSSLQIEARVKPATWLFAGPSGVGKTATATIMAEHLTGQPPITLNMAEYSLEHDQSKLVGSGPGYVGSDSNKELPFDILESNPYRLVLLDELEKAHPAVHRLLFNALDKGWMRMASGKIVDFSKTIIVATTNAGAAELAPTSIGFASEPMAAGSLSESRVADVLKRHGLDAAFIGRFENLVGFTPLDRGAYETILRAEFDRLAANPSLARRGLTVPAPSDDMIAEAVEASYNPALGARPAERAARRLVEDAILRNNPMLTATP